MSTTAADGDPESQSGPTGNPLPLEIFETLDAVLSLHREGSPTSQIVDQLDRLLEITRNYFRDEELALVHDDEGRKGPHLEVHRLIIDYIVNLRSHMDRFEQARLLPQLRFLDYWLTTHLSEEPPGTM